MRWWRENWWRAGKGEDTVRGGALGDRGIRELVFDGSEDKEASDRDLHVQVFSKLKMWFLTCEISVLKLEMI